MKAIASMSSFVRLLVTWSFRAKLYAEGAKLRAEGDKLWAEGDKLHAEGAKLYAEGAKLRAEGAKLMAEGAKLMAEGDKLMAEGDKLWAEGVLKVHGNITIEWQPNRDCLLETGERFNADMHHDDLEAALARSSLEKTL